MIKLRLANLMQNKRNMNGSAYLIRRLCIWVSQITIIVLSLARSNLIMISRTFIIKKKQEIKAR